MERHICWDFGESFADQSRKSPSGKMCLPVDGSAQVSSAEDRMDVFRDAVVNLTTRRSKP